MLRWRLLLGTLIIAVLVALCWLDYRATMPGVWLLPLAIIAAVLATKELLDLAALAGLRPLRWTVYLRQHSAGGQRLADDVRTDLYSYCRSAASSPALRRGVGNSDEAFPSFSIRLRLRAVLLAALASPCSWSFLAKCGATKSRAETRPTLPPASSPSSTSE